MVLEQGQYDAKFIGQGPPVESVREPEDVFSSVVAGALLSRKSLGGGGPGSRIRKSA